MLKRTRNDTHKYSYLIVIFQKITFLLSIQLKSNLKITKHFFFDIFNTILILQVNSIYYKQNQTMKKILSILVTFTLLLAFTTSISLFNLVRLPKTNGAMCMDGSQFGIYTYTPDDVTPPNKLLIFFEDDWEYWCTRENLNDSISRCYQYTNNTDLIDLGSSQNWGGSYMVLNGILSPNSIFGDWLKIVIKSCDGGSYFSDSSVVFKNKTLNFKGYKNVMQAISYMNKNNLLINREEIVIGGTGNGALAALAWADIIKSNTKGKVRVFSDAGIWQNQLNQKTKTPAFQNRMKNVDKLFLNGKPFPNTKCQAANVGSVQKCFYSTQLIKYVDPSIQVLFLQSYYDTWSALQILDLNCTMDFGSLSECTSEHRQAIQDYHKKISASVSQLVALPNVGAFAIACVGHYFTGGKFDNTDFSVPMNSNNTAQLITQKWITSKNATQKFNYIDSVDWPNNKPCSHQVKKYLKVE